jgi:hypothetical protein
VFINIADGDESILNDTVEFSPTHGAIRPSCNAALHIKEFYKLLKIYLYRFSKYKLTPENDSLPNNGYSC